MAKKDELVHQPQGVTALTTIPEYLQGAVGDQSGTEEVERNDITLPRIAICQSLTPQRKKSNPLYIEGLNDGELFNTVSGQIYGVAVKVVPVMFFKSRIKFHPLDQGGGIDCQAPNGKTGGHHSPASCDACAFSKWGEERPECTLFHNRAVLVLPELQLAVLSMKSTGIRVSKQWNAQVRLLNLPIYARVYEVGSVPETRAQNEYYQWTAKPLAFVPKELFDRAKGFFEGLSAREIKMDTTGLHEEEVDTRQPSM